MQPDEALVAAVAGGDEGALRVLYTRHSAVILRLIRRLTNNGSTAEEILQETWLAVWRSADAYRAESSVRSWLLGVARRQAHNRLRRSELPVVDLAEAETVVSAGVDIEAEVINSMGHAEIVAAILALPAHLREVALLALVDEMPYQDIGAVVGVAVGTVKSRMSHARSRLVRELAKNRAAS